jgi:mannose-6-phosphate isomerase
VKPLRLPPNPLHRFYLGGERIAALRGTPLEDDHTPEDWVGAANTSFGQDTEGLSRFEDGTLVRDAIAADPESFLGPEHTDRHGTDTALLVKLLDAGERLPVHYHPGRHFAAEHLGSHHGKTEAWLIVDAEPSAEVRVGFKEEPEPATVERWVRTQDTEAMLDALHPIPVSSGDAVFVPAGTAHAIGPGILMVELQEPTDFSILLEHERFGVTDEAGATLGLGWDRALEALDRQATDRPEAGPTLPHAADAYFRAAHVSAPATLEQGFGIIVVTEGDGRVGELAVAKGDTVLVPYAAGPVEVGGGARAVWCRPPAPDAEDGPW